jgi:hypothetical protein
MWCVIPVTGQAAVLNSVPDFWLVSLDLKFKILVKQI